MSLERQSRFHVKIWFLDVINDLGKLSDAISYYMQVIEDGENHLVPRGVLDQLLTEQAGLTYFYETAYNDAAKIQKWLEEKINYEKAVKYRWFLSAEGREQYGNLKTTEVKELVESEPEVFGLIESRLFADGIVKSLGSLVESLKERGIYLSMISKLRSAGQEEIMIDAGRETMHD